MYEAEIQAAIDRQLEIERKARAWDALLLQAERDWPLLVDVMDKLLHPAQNPSTCYGSNEQDAQRK